MTNKRIIALDTETTGIKPEDGHRIVEIGCVEIIDRIITPNKFHCYLNPKRDVPKEAVKVHGLTYEFLKDKELFESVYENFLEYISDSILVIHNAKFDMNFLNSELKNVGASILSFDRIIDSLDIARKTFPGSPNDLDSLCRRYNISTTHREKHGALIDAELLARVYIELIGGTQEVISFTDNKSNQFNENNKKVEYNKTYREPRHFPISEEEATSHKTFIETKIKNSLWIN